MITSTVSPTRHRSANAVTSAGAARGPLNVRFGDDDACRREAGRDRGRDVHLAAASLPVRRPTAARGKRGRRRLRSVAKSPSALSFCFGLSSAARLISEPKAFDRERRRRSPGLEELGPPVDVHALAVPDRGATRRIARAASTRTGRRRHPGVSVKKTLCQLLSPELRDLALDPDRRQARKPPGDTAIERGDAVDLAVAILLGRDFHDAMLPADDALGQTACGDSPRSGRHSAPYGHRVEELPRRI